MPSIRDAVRVTLSALICSAALMAGLWHLCRPREPEAFYTRPAETGDAKPGSLLRTEPFERALPAGSKGWRIVYTTTHADGAPAISSAIVVTADRPGPALRPVIAWAHGTTGIRPGCAPGVRSNPFANVPALAEVIAKDWAYVATDYAGLATTGVHAYLVGTDAARNVLDAVRAARSLDIARISDRVVVWGHSQGGNSALWTGIAAERYAPGLRVLGVAALAPASDLVALARSARGSAFGRIVSSYLVHGYAAAYADVEPARLVKPASAALARDIAGRCVGGWETLLSVLEASLLPHDGIFASDPGSGALGKRLVENTPDARIAAPVLIAQGGNDDLVPPNVQAAYVAARCASGQLIDYRTYAGLDHLSLVAAGSPLGADLGAWTQDRFDGRPAVANCRP